MTTQPSKDSGLKKTTLKGVVKSSSMDKTIVVSMDTIKTHSKYLKKYKSTKRSKVHDPNNAYAVGDVVEFESCRPISRDKCYVVKNLTKK